MGGCVNRSSSAGCHLGIANNLRPFNKAQIGGDHNAGALGEFGRQVFNWSFSIFGPSGRTFPHRKESSGASPPRAVPERCFICNAQARAILPTCSKYGNRQKRPNPQPLPQIRHHRRFCPQDTPSLDRHRDGGARRHQLPAAPAKSDCQRVRRHQQGRELSRKWRCSLRRAGRGDV